MNHLLGQRAQKKSFHLYVRDFQLASDRLFYLVVYQVERPSFVGVEGSVVELRVTVTGNPPPDVYWRKGPVRDIDTTRGRFRILGDGSLQVSSNPSYHCFAALKLLIFCYQKPIKPSFHHDLLSLKFKEGNRLLPPTKAFPWKNIFLKCT